jgi:hypothetical protein
MSETSAITGGCACGRVRYRALAAPLLMLKCHCRDCQRASGTGYAAIMAMQRDAVEIAGELRFHRTRGDDGSHVERGFCPSCGSPVANRLERLPGMIGLIAGSLDDPTLFRPAFDSFIASAPHWDPLAPETAKHKRGLPRK